MSDLRQNLLAALDRKTGVSSDFDLNEDVVPPQVQLRPAAVLVAVRAESERVILTKRSARLKHHPGQIAFPGGKQDPVDASLIAAALREAQEEVGLDPRQVQVLGTLPAHRTVTNFSVTPVVGIVEGAFTAQPEAGEVGEVFEVPLSFLLDPANYRVEGRLWQGRKRHYYAVPFGPYYIWGATARILRGLAERLQ